MTPRAASTSSASSHPAAAKTAARAKSAIPSVPEADVSPDIIPRKGKQCELRVGGRQVRLTNLNKPFWPELGITKGDLLHQEQKLAASGLGDLFAAVEIVSEKDASTYSRASLVWRQQNGGLSLSLGSLDERLGPLGAFMPSGSDFALPSRTTFYAVGGDWRLNAWANINRAGHGNEFHTHPGCYWSGTYYVDDGGIGADPSLGGEFEMQDPRGVAPAMYAPLLCFATPGGRSAGASELIRPRAGLLVLFPAWLSHGVRPYRGDRMRISIAFNLSL